MDTQGDTDRTAFLLALLDMNGIGRAAASRLFSSFSSFDDISRYPDEQIISRLKRIPKAAHIAQQLQDESVVKTLLAEKIEYLSVLGAKGIQIITPDNELWPSAYARYPHSARPPYLFVYGNHALLASPSVSIHHVGGNTPDDTLRTLVQRLSDSKISLILHDSDIAASIVPSYASLILVLRTGLEALSGPVRSAAAEIVKQGGLLISPFEMTHEHFAHDFPYLNAVVNGLADVVVYSDVPVDHPLYDDMLRLTEHDKPIFALNISGDFPDGIHPINDVSDTDWVLAAVGIVEK